MPPRSVDEWLALLQPALQQPLQQVQALINADPALLQWLQEAAYQAAMEASWQPDLYAFSAAYQRLQTELEMRFRELAAAIVQLTQGRGRLRLHWQPNAPQYSRVEIDFGRDYAVDLFIPLAPPLPNALSQALGRLRSLLPPYDPYPRRPHQVTAILAYQGRSPALQLLDHLTPTGHHQTAVIFVPDQQPSTEMSPEAALYWLHAYFSAPPHG